MKDCTIYYDLDIGTNGFFLCGNVLVVASNNSIPLDSVVRIKGISKEYRIVQKTSQFDKKDNKDVYVYVAQERVLA